MTLAHRARRRARRDAFGHAAVAAAPRRSGARSRIARRRGAHRGRCRSRADVQRAVEARRDRISKKNCRASSATSPRIRSAMLARSALGFARRARDTFAQNVAEYLQEEGRDVPSRTEAEEFLARRRRAARRRRPARSAPGAARSAANNEAEPRMRLRVLSRLLQIQRVLVRHRLDDIILATHLFRPLRFAFYLSPATWFRRERAAHARRAPAARARGARPDLHEVRPDALDAARPAAARHRRRAGEAAGPRAAVLRRRGTRASSKLAYERPLDRGVRALRRAAARRRDDRAGACGAAARTARKSSSRSCDRAFAR